ncbi:hypothetical protein IFO70_32665 [Phormidium tenue FACHB-886]|nr:hypothetical protein [Phormidium tenue FACHB-886]
MSPRMSLLKSLVSKQNQLFNQCLPLLATDLLLVAAPYLMQRFGTPRFVDEAIKANFNRQKAAAGGVWCVQINPDGSAKDILYSAEKCGLQGSQRMPSLSGSNR